MKEMKVRLTFFEEVLGSQSNDPEIHAEFIASKAPDAPSREEEIAAVGADEVIEKGKTVFPKDEEGGLVQDGKVRGADMAGGHGAGRGGGARDGADRAEPRGGDPRGVFRDDPGGAGV